MLEKHPNDEKIIQLFPNAGDPFASPKPPEHVALRVMRKLLSCLSVNTKPSENVGEWETRMISSRKRIQALINSGVPITSLKRVLDERYLKSTRH